MYQFINSDIAHQFSDIAYQVPGISLVITRELARITIALQRCGESGRTHYYYYD